MYGDTLAWKHFNQLRNPSTILKCVVFITTSRGLPYSIIQPLHISCNSSWWWLYNANQGSSQRRNCDNHICKQRIVFAWRYAFITSVYICASGRAFVPWESRLAVIVPATDDAVENVSGAGGWADVTMSKQSVVAPDISIVNSARNQPLSGGQLCPRRTGAAEVADEGDAWR